jgi:nitric-oxide synthase
MVVDQSEAAEFLARFYSEHPGEGDGALRVSQALNQIEGSGTYTHTLPELSYAARLAWRHADRCVGRDKWRTLRVRDRRHLSKPDDVAAEVIAHLREATNGGRIRSYITVFAPDTPKKRGPRVLNGEALGYAGYRRPNGTVMGDPLHQQLTTLSVRLGWEPRYGPFDVLPLIIQGGDGRLSQYPVPMDAVLEVPISHPDHEWFAELGLRWYAVPLITDMYLDAGGIKYPCTPFNGWYVASTEVGVRDLGDERRYNVLPAVADGLGLDTSRVDTFWMDRAAVELAVAVHHSYRNSGVMTTDHQSEARRFAKHADAEQASGCPFSADWSWVNPPISASTTPTFHRTYPEQVLKPGYFRHKAPLPSR